MHIAYAYSHGTSYLFLTSQHNYEHIYYGYYGIHNAYKFLYSDRIQITSSPRVPVPMYL